MKFIRDLIEQKSSEIASSRHTAFDEDDGHQVDEPMSGAIDGVDAPQAPEQSVSQPFQATNLHRVQDFELESTVDAYEEQQDDIEEDWNAELSREEEEVFSATAGIDSEEDEIEEDEALFFDDEQVDDDFSAQILSDVLSGEDDADLAPEEEAAFDAIDDDEEEDTSSFDEEPQMQSEDEPEHTTVETLVENASSAFDMVEEAGAGASAQEIAQPSAAEPVASESDTTPMPVEVPLPATGRGKSRAGRAKTRLLGFNSGMGNAADPFAKAAGPQGGQGSDGYTEFPVGWLVVVEGPGRGAAFTLYNGVAQIGRGEDQTVRLDFGDNSISRENHAAIAYDAEQNSFFIGHGGKANLVRCNKMPVLSTQVLAAGDNIRIGETTLRFVPLCSSEFEWSEGQKGIVSHAAHG